MWYKVNMKGYVCGSHGRYGKKFCKSNHKVREAFLCEAIADDIANKAKILGQEVQTLLDSKFSKLQKQSQNKLDSIQNSIRKANEKKKRLLDLLINETIDEPTYQEGLLDLQGELQSLKAKQAEVETSMQREDITASITYMKEQIRIFMESLTLTPEVLHRLVKRIDIHADGTPVIYYNFSVPSAIFQP
jgi:hypothetical protein